MSHNIVSKIILCFLFFWLVVLLLHNSVFLILSYCWLVKDILFTQTILCHVIYYPPASQQKPNIQDKQTKIWVGYLFIFILFSVHLSFRKWVVVVAYPSIYGGIGDQNELVDFCSKKNKTSWTK